MIIQKIMEFKLDLINSDDIYTQNLDETFKKLLSEKFVGKCFNSCYIVKINKILKTSEIYMSDELNGAAQCDICFEVDGLVYLKGEVITGCVIQKIETGGQTYAETDKVSLQFNQDPGLAIYKKGYIIPAIIDKVRYPVGKDKISALALPFYPVFSPQIIYKITEPLSNSDDGVACLNMLLNKISEEENKIKKLSLTELKSYEFFKNLLYPFKKVKSIEKSTTNQYKSLKFKEHNFDIFKTAKEGYICRPIELEKFKPLVYYSTDIGDTSDMLNISLNTMFDISLLMHQDYLQYLILLRELVSYYPDIKTIQQYADVWKMYNHLKKSE
jgi:hypothetical protein